MVGGVAGQTGDLKSFSLQTDKFILADGQSRRRKPCTQVHRQIGIQVHRQVDKRTVEQVQA